MAMGKLDMLNSLPMDIIHSILIHLPVSDAVRTSILARRWRYAWNTCPRLNLCYQFQNSLSKDMSESDIASIVDHIFLLHKGLIQSFSFELCLPNCSSFVDKWIHLLSQNGIQELILDFEHEEFPWVPTYLFSCKQLIYLELNCCILKIPSSFTRFSYMENLYLSNISLTEEMIEGLVSGCPRLKRLKLDFLDKLTSLRICDSPNLEALAINGRFEDLSLVGTSGLVHVFISRRSDGDKRNDLGEIFKLQKVLGPLQSVQMLAMRCCFEILATGTILKRLPGTFNCLKTIHFTLDFHNAKERLTALCLLRSSPQLQDLRILAMTSEKGTNLAEECCVWEEDENMDCPFERLKFIMIRGIKGKDVEMKFMQIVMASAPKLVRMRFTIDDDVIYESRRIFKKMLQFPRLSPVAEVVNF